MLEGLPDVLRRNSGERSACLVCFSAVPSETLIGMSKVALFVRLDRSSDQISFISQVGATVLK